MKDVLIRVKGLTFPSYFYVINMSVNSPSDLSLPLGRPFLKIACALIDVDEEFLTLLHGEISELFFVSDSLTTNHTSSSSSILQDRSSPPKLEVDMGDGGILTNMGKKVEHGRATDLKNLSLLERAR